MNDIFERELQGEMISVNDPEYHKILDIIWNTMELTAQLNASFHSQEEVHDTLYKITGKKMDESLLLLPPFYTDFGKNITIGKNVVIQQLCTFFDRGGITIGDGVFIGPKVNLITLNHNLEPDDRSTTTAKPIIIKENAWIGINSTILPGVTIGKNAVVAAGSVVTKDVDENAVVGGNPARLIKKINARDCT